MDNIINLVGSSNNLDEKMQALKRKSDTLCSRGHDINTQLERAESSSTKKRKQEVENWLGNVERTKRRVQDIELQVSGSGSYLGGIVRSKQLADRVEDLTKEVAEYMEQGLFPQGLTLDAHEEVALLAPKLVGQAFERNLNIILEHLRNDDVLIIGVWGMGGVGKTTLVKHIHNQIQQQSDTFGHVYWVTVSQNSSIRKLQDDVAKAIHFDFACEDDESKRAAKLSRELMRRMRTVLILDDMWNDFCLESVGIVTAVNGCKLLITTRSLDVCRRLHCQPKIKVEPLSYEEAWYLFEKALGYPKMALSTEVFEVAKCVAQECAGLPLGIVTLAISMREVNDIREWRNVLRALKESEVLLMETGMEEKVFKVLELSYNRLNDPIVQQCFLYCALYPEDYEVEREELIRCLIDERLIGQMKDMQTQFDRGHTILNKLVNSGLLEKALVYPGVDLDGVKMHDLVRDMAIKKMGSQFMVKAGMQLKEIPEEKEWLKDVERVSLIDNKIKEIASNTSPTCPKLLTLFLDGNLSLKRIENSFFEHMPALQVLRLSHCGKIEELPSSISNLKNLSALVLSCCWKLQHMPSLADVTSLKRLDLKCSDIREIPHGVEMLVNLTYLDLSETKGLEVFPSGILPKLSRLEYLKFDLKVKIKGEELKGLERLSTFQGSLIFDDKVNDIMEQVMMTRGKYAIESYNRRYNLNEVTLRNWSIRKITEEDDKFENLVALLKDVQFLVMEKCKVAGSLSDVWWVDNATQDLKSCSIKDCEEIECVGLFSNTCSSSPLFFQTLEKLSLSSLENLRILFEMEGEGGGHILPPSLPVAVFSCLKSFSILECHNIKKLFQPGFLPYLQNLEEIYVSCCDGLEEIIACSTTTKEEEESMSSSSNNNNNRYHSYSDVQYSLPKLKTLSLVDLPKLKSICEGTMACDALEKIQVDNCPMLQRIPLSKPPPSFQAIQVHDVNAEEWWESLKWDDPDAKNLFQPHLDLSTSKFFRFLAGDIINMDHDFLTQLIGLS